MELVFRATGIAAGQMGRAIDTVRLPGSIQTGENRTGKLHGVLHDAIMRGAMKPGDRLPSTRDLALQWKVSRGVILEIYARLIVEGLVTSKKGAGSFVARSACAHPWNPSHAAPVERPWETRRIEPPTPLPFIARRTDQRLFPLATWRSLTRKTLSRDHGRLASSSNPAGSLGLRIEVARYIGQARGIPCEPDDIVITTGSRHSLDLIARVLQSRSSHAWIEAPGYPKASTIFALAGMAVGGVPVDSEGIVVGGSLADGAEGAVIFVTPAHQSPTGVLMSPTRRRQLLDCADALDHFIVEDDYDGDFQYDDVRAPALKSLDNSDRVFYLGSFNKTLFSGLRIGYLIVPRQFRDRLLSIKADTSGGNSDYEQIVLQNFIGEGYYTRHIRRSEKIYAKKMMTLLSTLHDEIGSSLKTTGTHCGFHFCLWHRAFSNGSLAACARSAAIEIEPVIWDRPEGVKHGLIIGFSALDMQTIDRYGRELSNLMKRLIE